MSPRKKGEESLVFIVGAGASTYMGVPTMKQFTKDFRQSLAKDRKTELVDLSRTLMKKSQRADDLENLLIEVGSAKMLDKNPSVGLLMDAIGEQEKKLLPKGAKRRLLTPPITREIAYIRKQCVNLEKEILDFIRHKCRAYDRSKAKEQYEEILRLSEKTRLSMFTTNYDPIIEYVCEELDIEYSDNFGIAKRNRWFFDGSFESFGQKAVDIVKLHGSVTWYKDPNLDKIERIRHQTSISEEGHRIENLMIMPAKLKDIYSDPFFKLYKEFLDTLDSTGLCIVMGHSLRDEYIRGAIEERLRHSDFIAVVVSPTLLHKRRKDELKEVCERINVIYCPFRIEKFSAQLAEIISEYPTEREVALNKLLDATETEVQRRTRGPKLTASVGNTHLYRGERVTVEATFNGECQKGYFESRLTDFDNNTHQTVEDPTHFDEKRNVGRYNGRTNTTRTWSLKVPPNIELGRCVLMTGFYDNPAGEGKWNRRTLRERKLVVRIG